MCCYKIVGLDYKMSSSSANGASTIYILSSSLALVRHHFCQIHQYSLVCILQCYFTRKAIILCALFQAYVFRYSRIECRNSIIKHLLSVLYNHL